MICKKNQENQERKFEENISKLVALMENPTNANRFYIIKGIAQNSIKLIKNSIVIWIVFKLNTKFLSRF